MYIVPACCYEKDLLFSQEIWAANIRTLVKISWLIFSAVLRGGIEKFIEIRAGSLSCLTPSLLDFSLTAMLRALVLQFSPAFQREPARRLIMGNTCNIVFELTNGC